MKTKREPAFSESQALTNDVETPVRSRLSEKAGWQKCYSVIVPHTSIIMCEPLSAITSP